MPHLSTRVLQGLLTLLLTLFGLLLVTFALSAFSPVDRVLQIVGDHASQSTYDQVRHQLGLDRPLPVQFWHYLVNLAHGDLGTASSTGQPWAARPRNKSGPIPPGSPGVMTMRGVCCMSIPIPRLC